MCTSTVRVPAELWYPQTGAEELIAFEDPARPAEQLREQIELRGRQRHLRVTGPGSSTAHIDPYAAHD